MTDLMLRDYQQTGVDFLRDRGRAVLADEMGVGKTPQLICAAEGETLVVAPPGLHSNWLREIDRWGSQSKSTGFRVATYHSLTDRTVKDKRGHVRGTVVEEHNRPFDTVIFDECHHLKGRNTGYAKAGVTICHQAERVYLASGTPVSNWADDIYMLCKALYPKDRRFSSYWRWVDRWFSVHEDEIYVRGRGGKPVTQTVKRIGGLRSITTWETFAEENGIAERWLRRTIDSPEVGLGLPPSEMVRLAVKMGPTQAKAYRSMEKDFFASDGRKSIIATNSGSQWSSLMRLASGAGFHPELGSGPSAKLDALGDLVSGNDGPFLVFAWYHYTVDVLVDWFTKLGYRAKGCHGGLPTKSNRDAVTHFSEGELDVLIGTYPTLAEGHTFTNCNKTILFEQPMTPGPVDQAVARTRRFGQQRATVVWSLVAEGTLEEYYLDSVLPRKRGQAESVLRASELRDYRK